MSKTRYMFQKLDGIFNKFANHRPEFAQYATLNDVNRPF